MLMTDNPSGHPSTEPQTDDHNGLSSTQFVNFFNEISMQPPWRSRADREMDYYDGNQLNSEVLKRQQEIGMPPAIEPLIGPTIDSVLGMEAKTRTDWRVIADSETTDDELAEGLSFKLTTAERQSGADRAVSEAYASMIKVGIGWVEVSRNTDPFKFTYRCDAIHRNEIWWDFLSKKPDLSDARYLIRRRWTDSKIAALMFPTKKTLIEHAVSGWSGFDVGSVDMDGGSSTGLGMSWDFERGWSIEEQEWRDTANNRVCLFEVWYRDWERVMVMKTPDGRVVEYDETNEKHLIAVASGYVKMESAIISRMRLAWYMGGHKLWDGDTPYKHNNFPYIPFWGKREDRTGVPYALIRGMMYLQDEVNARISKMQWGLSSVRTTRTKGAVAGTDEQFRQEVARPDADIILNQQEMSKQGAVFKVERDFQLDAQQAQRLADARESIKRTGGIYNAFLGDDSQAKSGVAISGLVEQSTQTLADINDNYKFSRAAVGDTLLSLIIEDMLEEGEQEIKIPGNVIKDDKTIVVNQPVVDESTGVRYLNNDIERAKLKVVLNDVPSTPTFRAQQLSALSEAFKSMPTEYQKIALPHLLTLMDIPDKKEILEAIKKAGENPSPEQIQQLIDDAVAKALLEAKIEQSAQELKIKDFTAKSNAHNNKIKAEADWMRAEADALQSKQESNVKELENVSE
ncbi:MAG: hypothetical protein CTY35_05410 [Methylotenera sp.]|nr:MAG: hypothetical protein CTY35_05410 [Methylotenera sp.]